MGLLPGSLSRETSYAIEGYADVPVDGHAPCSERSEPSPKPRSISGAIHHARLADCDAAAAAADTDAPIDGEALAMYDDYDKTLGLQWALAHTIA